MSVWFGKILYTEYISHEDNLSVKIPPDFQQKKDCWSVDESTVFYKLFGTTSSFAKKKKPVNFDDVLKIGDVRYTIIWPK